MSAESATGLTDADFIFMPVFYETAPYGGVNFAVAENPGVQNCIPINDTLYMPSPAGPADPSAPGLDVWQSAILAAVAPTRLKIVWVDVYTSYHQLMGEAHCGSNVIYAPYATPWWTK
jgi:protein-arginine deiminase